MGCRFLQCLKSATIAPQNMHIRVDLAFLVRLQRYFLEIRDRFGSGTLTDGFNWTMPDIKRRIVDLEAAAKFGLGSQKVYFGGLTILPCTIKLSVAPARALTPVQEAVEGKQLAAIHQAVRKGDIKLENSSHLLGVKVGHRNSTALAVVRGVFKSFVVDALLRLDGASLDFAGVSLRQHISTGPQLSSHLSAHYMQSLRQNLPSLLASLAMFGNPLGLMRGLGDGVRYVR
jgi:Vacuolar-sorting-associated 13 protein C-terminal